MENQFNVDGQNIQQDIQSPVGQPDQTSEKPKVNYWIILAILLTVVLLGSLGWYILGTKQDKGQKNINSLPTQPPTSESTSPVTNTAVAFFKDGNIYASDYQGTIRAIFDVEQEELTQPNSLYIKFSPDKRFIAYLGTSGGLDSAIKVIDVNLKKKIFQDVYGSAYITDFAWSPDSKKIAVAVNLKNNEENFTAALYLVDPFNQVGGTYLFTGENIEITHVEWPTSKYIFYSRLSYAKETFGTAGIVSYDLETKSRKVKNLTSWATPSFWFVVSPLKDKVLFYTLPDFAPVPDAYSKMLALPSLEETTPEINFAGDVKGIDWFDNYLVGISMPFGSPDQSVVLYDLSNNQTQSLLDLGPSGTFHSVKLLKQNAKTILMVWSEFDEKHSISVYDLEQLTEMRKKAYVSEPLWRLVDSSSLGL